MRERDAAGYPIANRKMYKSLIDFRKLLKIGLYSPVAQQVEQTVVSRPVGGSIPFPGSQLKQYLKPYLYAHNFG